MKKQRYTTQALLAGALMLAGAQTTQAATISVSVDPPTVDGFRVGETFIITLKGSEFTDGSGGTLGAGVNIEWNSSVLKIDNLDTDVTLLFPGTDDPNDLNNFSDKGDNSDPGFLNYLSVATFNGTDKSEFEIASIDFTIVGAGETEIKIEPGTFRGDGGDNVWTDITGVPLDLESLIFEGETVTVVEETAVVPLPAAAWFLVSGILGLAAVGRRARKKVLNTFT